MCLNRLNEARLGLGFRVSGFGLRLVLVLGLGLGLGLGFRFTFQFPCACGQDVFEHTKCVAMGPFVLTVFHRIPERVKIRVRVMITVTPRNSIKVKSKLSNV